jgi:hypothetical protein
MGLWLVDATIRRWSLLWLVPLLGMTLAGFVTHSLPSHNWWRLASPALVLLLPFAAQLIVTYCRTLSRSRPARAALMALAVAAFMAAFWHQSTEIAQRSDFTHSDREAGALIKRLAPGDGERVLIDSLRWNYLHVIVASNRPELFVLNTGFDPRRPQPAVVTADSALDLDRLRQERIRYAVFCEGMVSEAMAVSDAFSLVKRIPPWIIFRFQERPQPPGERSRLAASYLGCPTGTR